MIKTLSKVIVEATFRFHNLAELLRLRCAIVIGMADTREKFIILFFKTM